jgi:ABC-type Co2+ transport system permease subunit
VWEFNWGVFWAVLAALAVCSLARKLNRAARKEEFWLNLAMVGLGIFVLTIVATVIGAIFSPHFREILQHLFARR